MANIKQIKLPSGTTYDIVDQGARDLIAGLSGSTKYLGVTTTELVDNVTTSPNIVVAGETVTASAGGIATYGSKEFIYSGSVWQEFGDLSALGELAYKDSASGSYTPAGSVTVGTTTGKKAVSKASSGATTYTPEGSVALTTTSESIALTRGTGTSSNYTVKEAKTVTVGTSSTTPTITLAAGASGNGYQVTGTVGTPTITVTPSTATVNSITDVGSLPSFSATVANEILTLGFSQGTLPTKGSDQTVATGIASATSSQPSFTGGYVKATSSAVTTPTGSSTITYDYTTLTDSVDIPTSATFNGTAVRLETDNINEPSGANSFSGTAATITVE